MRKNLLIASNASVALARRTATTAAPTFRFKICPLAIATMPARSISALTSALTLAKYVGDPMTIPSASTILSTSPLRMSPVTEQCRCRFSKHFMHAVHPRIFRPPSCTSSVSIPSLRSSSRTAWRSVAVLPLFLGLPLNATTFMSALLSIRNTLSMRRARSRRRPRMLGRPPGCRTGGSDRARSDRHVWRDSIGRMRGGQHRRGDGTGEAFAPGCAIRYHGIRTENRMQECQEMNSLTESDKTFLECFEIVAKRPYMGFLAGVVLFSIGMALYSKGLRNDQPSKILLAGFFFGLSLFEIMESYLAYRLYSIFEKMKSRNV